MCARLTNVQEKHIQENQNRDNEDHIVEKAKKNSVSHCHVVHKHSPLHQALKIPDAKAAVDKSWNKLKNTPAWQESKVKSKREVIDRAQKEGKIVFLQRTWIDAISQNSELDKKFKKDKGRVVQRGDVVKDDSSSYTTEASESTI